MKTQLCVSIPVETKEKATAHRLPFSAIMNEALLARIEDLERAQLGGTPAPGHQPTEPEANNFESRT